MTDSEFSDDGPPDIGWSMEGDNPFGLIFKHSPVPKLVYRVRDHRILASNLAALQMLGYPETELREMSVDDLFLPGDRPRMRAALVDDDRPRTLTCTVRDRSGKSLGEVQTSSTAAQLSGERIRIVMFHDFAIRRQFDHDVQRLAGALEATVEGVAILRDEHYVMVNPAHAEMYGYTVEEQLGKSWRMLYDEVEVRRLQTESFPKLMQTGQWRGTTRGRRKDGSEIFGEISLTLTATGDLVCACRDISERLRQEEAVRRSREMLSWVLEATEEGTWDWDVATGQVEFSHQWNALLGHVPGELPNGFQTWSDRLHPDDRARVLQEVDRLLLPDSGIFRCEYRLRHRDGTWRWVTDRGKVVSRDGEGRALRAVGAFSDITGRRQAELSLQQRTRELVEANAGLARAAQVRDEFLARISHELRTPLTTILALSEMLLGNGQDPLSTRQRRRVSSIQESGQHLVELIDEILDVAKLEAGTMKLSLERVELRTVAEQAVRLVSPAAQAKEIRLSFRPGPAGLSADADPLRLKQVLVNLLGNAVKFTPAAGDVRLEIARSQDTCRGPYVELRVTDTGIGIPEEQQASIFQPFVQLDSGLDRAYGGSGLGLFLVRHFTERMGGEVALVSAPGRGTEFCVRLPEAVRPTVPVGIDPVPDNATQGTRARPAPARAQESAAPPAWEILLVDDNATNRDLIAEYLEDQGFTVRTAPGGPAALERLQAGGIGLAFVDVQMPGMDGLELTRRIRAHPDPKIAGVLLVGLTALAMAGDRERCLAAGMNAYLSKPFALSRLPDLIRQFAADPLAGITA